MNIHSLITAVPTTPIKLYSKQTTHIYLAYTVIVFENYRLKQISPFKIH